MKIRPTRVSLFHAERRSDGQDGQTDTAKATVANFSVALRTNQKVSIDRFYTTSRWLLAMNKTNGTRQRSCRRRKFSAMLRWALARRRGRLGLIPSKKHNIDFHQLSTSKHSLSKCDWLWGPTSVLFRTVREKPDAGQSRSKAHRGLLRVPTVPADVTTWHARLHSVQFIAFCYRDCNDGLNLEEVHNPLARTKC